jgi:cation diffusion facilitator CzcD-associated flavoprotein CzcO
VNAFAPGDGTSPEGAGLDSADLDSADLDVAIIGAGFGGLYALYKMREIGLTARVFEQGSGVGGTWFWNRYPGARCDVESVDYSYSFSTDLQQEWTWTERYPRQPDILRYLNHVADRFELRRDIQLGARVRWLTFDEPARRWNVVTDGGEPVTARFCVAAVGCLSAVNWPRIEGIDKFAGLRLHTARWPQDVDLSGLRVGVIGTGSTGIQLIPELARQASELFVFQRTPNYSVPAVNRTLGSDDIAEIKAHYPERRKLNRSARSGIHVARNKESALAVDSAARHAEFQRRWRFGGGTQFLASYRDLLSDLAANELAAEFVREQIRATVHDPAVAELLSPRDYPIGAKRICVDTDYYATYNRPNVTLVDLRSHPIEHVTVGGVRLADREIELDCLICATGFDAISGALAAIDIRGTAGASLADSWRDGPRSYLGLMVAEFPNLFTVTGPGSPSVLANMVLAIEQHVDWIAAAISRATGRGQSLIECRPEAEEAWVRHIAELAAPTVYHRANSWFVGANIPGKPRVFMIYAGGLDRYIAECDEITADDYRGFSFRE